MTHGKKLTTLVAILGCFVFSFGCASKATLDTPSGRPEIEIESLHIKPSDVSSMLANYYVDRGYRIVRQNEQRLILDGHPTQTMMSRYRHRLTFNYINSRNKMRVVAQIERLNLPLTGGSRVSSVSDVAPGGSAGQTVQEVLSGIKDALINDEQFKGIETENNETPEDETESPQTEETGE